MKEVME